MKSIEQIKKEIEDTTIRSQNVAKELACDAKRRNREVRKCKAQVAHLRSIILFLESNPSKDFLEKEEARLEGIIEKTDLACRAWIRDQSISMVTARAKCAELKKERSYPKIKKQLSNIQYILY